MNRPQVFWITGLLVMLAAIIWMLTRAGEEPAGKAPAPPSAKPAQVAAPPQIKATLPPQPDVGVENEAAADLQRITRLLRDYRTIAGDNPIGSNAEIAQALAGDNLKHAKILPDELPRNGSGELVDRWGTPYFFHQLSRNSMEIRSAGSDRRMWTSDDVVTR